MRAIEISRPGPPDVLHLTDRPDPSPSAGEVLIAVDAAGVNRPDLMQREGTYPPPKGVTDIPGLEIAGHVVACGEKATRFRLGDPVCALVPGGGYAEYCLVHETNALPVPQGFSLVEAGVLENAS